MTTRTKALAAGAALFTMLTVAAPAEARSRWVGPAIGGFVAGAMIGAAATGAWAAGPAYNCRYVEQYDQWGMYLGTTKVCRPW